jgi:hypothetical protein
LSGLECALHLVDGTHSSISAHHRRRDDLLGQRR